MLPVQDKIIRTHKPETELERPMFITTRSFPISPYTLMTVLTIIAVSASGAPPIPLFEDLALNGGFRLSAVSSTQKPLEVGTVLVSDPAIPAAWRLAQWGTKFSLEGIDEKRDDTSTRILGNAAKEVVVYPGGLSGQGILLRVIGATEYGNTLRKRGEPWPHLLIEQRLPAIGLNRYKEIRFHVKFSVEQCTSTAVEPMDPGLHTAHITAFWTIHNQNPESKDFKDMIWFGLPLFDARYPIPRGHQAVDTGKGDASGKFICTLPGDRFYREPVEIGVWNTLACDLVPLLAEALEISRRKGFLTETTFSDLALTSFNLGWEVPGSYNCAIRLHSLSFTGIR